MAKKVWFGAALLGLGLAVGTTFAWATPTASTKAASSHLLLHLALENGQLSVVSSRVVDMPLRQRSIRPGPDTRYRVVLVSDEGKVVYETGMNDPFELRGEWPAEDGSGRIEGVHLRQTGRVDFSVRVPATEAATIRVLGVPAETPRMVCYEPRSFVSVGEAVLSQEVRP